MRRDPTSLTRELLGHAPDAIEPLLVRDDRATHRLVIGRQRFVIKADDDHKMIRREVEGHRRAAAAGIRVPELLAVADDAFAMKWVDGVALQHCSTPSAWNDTGAQIRIAHDVPAGPPFGERFGPAQPTWREFIEAFAERELSWCEQSLDFPGEQAHRIRAAVRAAAPRLDTPNVGWCHGDFQPDHVLVDPATGRVTAIIDWADHGSGDVGWDVTVLTIDDTSHLAAFLQGYDASDELRAALEELLPVYSIVRLLGEAHWLTTHDHPAGDKLRRAFAWRP